MFPTSLAIPLLALSFITASTSDVHQGNVLAVGDNTITIQDKNGAMESFLVAVDCKITHSGKPATLRDIDNGDMAKITVMSVQGKLVATVIEARCRE